MTYGATEIRCSYCTCSCAADVWAHAPWGPRVSGTTARAVTAPDLSPQSSAHGGLRLGLVLGPGHGDADGGLCGRGGAPPGGLDAASGGRKRQCVRRAGWIPGGRPATGGCGVGACQGGGGRAGGGRGQQAGGSRCADGGDPRHLLSGE